MRTIGIGIIGWGFMGKTHAQAIRSLPIFYPGCGFRAEIRSVCARHGDRARLAAEALDIPHHTDDWREVIARSDVDVVSVCTPNDQHEAMAVAALKAGKHVYIDKPLAVTAESANRIAAAARDAAGFTRVAFNNRFLPATLRAKALVEEGRIGEVLTFSARYLHSGSIDPNRPIGWKQQRQGGVLLDLGSHALDLLVWLAGRPSRALCAARTLYAQRPMPGGGTETALSEDHAQMLLQLPNGAIGGAEASKIATGACDELTLELRGGRGALRFNTMDLNYLYYCDNTRPEAPLGGLRGWTQIECVGRYPAPGGSLMAKNSLGWNRGHTHCYFTFLEAVARGQRPDCGVDEAAALQRLMDALSRSAQNGGWVEVDP